jgi:predicted dehydrogenase
MAHFIDSIKKRIEPKPGLKEGITVLNIVDAAYKSAKTGKVIPVVQ